ncbi:MAG: Crp/Fnr family transcriptional regulator [Lachnospiraceae bacterium]|nr:Crp/Fnr family transcriptional regulator [Lachnospiraceae bacterium]
MQKYIKTLKGTRLFSGVGEDEILSMLGCLQARKQTFRKGDLVFRRGEHIRNLTILAEGKLLIQKDDFWGNRSIVNVIHEGEMFGEAYITPESGAILNDVTAEEDSTVLFFDIQRILTVCPSACKFHSLLIQNLFYAISEKNRNLVQKIGHMSKRSTRAKLLSYLSEQAGRHNAGTFTIPFNRQQLADFLSVDRSAMCSELSKMQEEGLLTYHKNKFTLHASEDL